MENQNTPLWDASLDINERLDWLLEALNLDEKCRMFSTLTPEVARLGIRSTYLGEEAAHGVEAKHLKSSSAILNPSLDLLRISSLFLIFSDLLPVTNIQYD